MRRAIAILLAAALAGGVLALNASGDEPAPPERKVTVAAIEKPRSELPPLPEMRPKVVEPRAGDIVDEVADEPDAELEEVGPRPRQPASRGVQPPGTAQLRGGCCQRLTLNVCRERAKFSTGTSAAG